MNLDLVILESLHIKDFMSTQAISCKSRRDISTCAFCLGSSYMLKSPLRFPPSSFPSASTPTPWIQQKVCTTDDLDGAQPLLFFLHPISTRPPHPWDVAKALPLPLSKMLTTSLYYHLWLLLLPLIFHHVGDGEKEAVRFPHRQAFQSHRN